MEFQQPNGDGQPYPPQILPFVPKQLLGITPYHSNTDGWIYGNDITGDNHNFSTQWLECIYPISGTYAATPRLIYYVFLLVPFVPRIPWLRKSWLREAALTLVMTYSSTTAIHALILVSTWKRMAPDGMLDAEKHEIVQVQGNWTGTYQTSTNLSYHQNNVTLADGTRQLNDHLWMPLLPMVRDHDADPVLSILGSVFLLFLPLQIWSRTMQEPRFRFLWPAWGVILLIGFVSALVYEDLTIFWNMWQLRFCPGRAPNDKDLLPFANTRDDYSMFGG
ncbi:putative integral membrane protein [Neofusicoccum parvum]|uniref:Integral membrane protein n=1 Tax=Neofusicoccum parvum TaxID=310453 RepID=A0ACB5RSX0_9PEZI|nr:putative integral membrane protein [Neofusicoccum parvum]